MRSWRAVSHFLRSPFAFVHGFTHDLLTTIFPGECRVCAEPLTLASRLPVCQRCLHELAPRTHTGCRRCGDRLDLANDLEDLSFRGMECLTCRLAPPEFERAVSFGTYEDILRELIHLFKYGGMPLLARSLGEPLAVAIAELKPEAAADLLVIAVPLFAGAERARGYNQAKLLADEAMHILKQTHPAWTLRAAHHLLRRKKSTASQYTLSRRGRRRNLEGAFGVSEAARAQLKHREVLLIDDVLTTGATARECSRVLRRAGAAKVWVATVARACGADSRQAHQTELSHAVARWGEPTH